MIRISIDVDKMRLKIEGHAGYAPAGQDIICASVSTLAYTLIQNLAMLLHPDEYAADIKDGYAYIEAHPPDDIAEECRSIFMVIANGLCMLAIENSQYIQFEGE